MAYKVLPALTPPELAAFTAVQPRSNPYSVMVRLHDWWKKEKDATPLAYVGFVNCGLRDLHFLHNKGTRLALTLKYIEHECGGERDRPFVVFYALLGSWTDEIFILGGYAFEKLKDALESEHGLRIGDLIQSRTYDVSQLVKRVWAGSLSKRHWFHLPFVKPNAFERMKDAHNNELNTDAVKYRIHLMLVFWKERKNPEFETDMRDMLMMLHEGIPPPKDSAGFIGAGTHYEPGLKADAFFNLTTADGRHAEYSSYWTAVWLCAHNREMWERRAHFERVLFEFRVRRYWYKENHFALFLSENRLCAPTNYMDSTTTPMAIVIADPDDRERDLYRQRWPYGLVPTVWLSVLVKQVSKAISASPLYDIDGGRVIITYRDFEDWVITCSELASHELTCSIYSASQTPAKSMRLGNLAVGSLLDEVMTFVNQELNREEDEMILLRSKRRAASSSFAHSSSSSGGPKTVALYNVNKRESLLELAKHFLPPCMARHIWQALVNGIHPKHESRVSLIKFFIEAEYTNAEVDRIIYLLYEADRNYIRTDHSGTWNDAEFKKVFEGQVKNMHAAIIVKKRISAYGCASLISDDKRNKSHGCPFAMTSGNEARSYLEWAGVTDIEDVMRFKNPQERCCRYYQDRHPNRNPLTIKHPNQFFRGTNTGGSGDTTKKIKIEPS